MYSRPLRDKDGKPLPWSEGHLDMHKPRSDGPSWMMDPETFKELVELIRQHAPRDTADELEIEVDIISFDE